jgi:hypothetical protein
MLLTAGYFVRFIFAACLEAHISTTELKRSINASAIVEKIDSEPEVIAATSCKAKRIIFATTEP